MDKLSQQVGSPFSRLLKIKKLPISSNYPFYFGRWAIPRPACQAENMGRTGGNQ